MSLWAAIRSFVAAVCAVSLVQAPLAAQDAEADISISGTSTVRNWTCEVAAPVEVNSGDSAPEVPGFPGGVESATVTVPVADIECPEEEMEEHLREAMRVEEFPEIVYELEEYTVSGSTARMTGSMTILGTTNPIEFEADLEPDGQEVRVSGQTSLDMTEYGVEPPTVMLGMLTVGDVVTLEFSTAAPGASQ